LTIHIGESITIAYGNVRFAGDFQISQSRSTMLCLLSPSHMPTTSGYNVGLSRVIG